MCYLITGIIIAIFGATPLLYADTIILNNGKSVKGLVVEEYIDRIKLNTADGEKDIFRKEIDRIEYDTPEQNFMQLGRAYDAKGWYSKAAFYYKKAMELNPDYKKAREAYLATHAKRWREEEKLTKKELARQNMLMDWRRRRNKKNPGAVSQAKPKDKMFLLNNVIGLSLGERGGSFIIEEVKPYSSAAKAGLKKGDILVAVWGKSIKYSKMDDVVNELLGPKYSEVRIAVQKEILVPMQNGDEDLYEGLGVLLDFEYEGLVVKEVEPGKRAAAAGIEKGDFVIAIDGNMTRYLPIDGVIALIRSAGNNKKINFTVRRTINLRREGR